MPFRYYRADRIREKMPQYKGTDEELQEVINDVSLLYNSAIMEMETKLQILSDDFDKKYSYMPIHHIQSRLKSFESILEKAVRYGIEDPLNNIDRIKREILDIAGVRVVCNYEEDMHTMSGLLLSQEDVQLIRMKDACRHLLAIEFLILKYDSRLRLDEIIEWREMLQVVCILWIV